MTRLRTAIALSLGLAAATVGCRPDDQETGSISREDAAAPLDDVDPEVARLLQEGNEAFRAGDHATARDRYTSAAERDDDVAAVWFGLYMAEKALGNAAAADAALERAQDLAPGATLIHPATTDTLETP